MYIFQENLTLIFQLLATFTSSNDYFFRSEKNSVEPLAFPLHPYILLGERSLLVTRKGQPYRLRDFIICQWCLVQGDLCRGSDKQNLTSSELAKAILLHNRAQASLINCLLSPLHQKTIEQQGAPRFCGHFLTKRVFLSF